jgi:hypothetical protein
MRDDMREAIGETVQGLVNLGLPTTFTNDRRESCGRALLSFRRGFATS